MGHLGVDGRIIVRRILKNSVPGCGLDLPGSRYDPGVG